jgi:hypothetical protein
MRDQEQKIEEIKNLDSGKFLQIGLGDIAKKESEEAIPQIKNEGYEILSLDMKEDPVGQEYVQPKKHFLRERDDHNKELKHIGWKDGFDAIYVANLSHQHITTAIEFQDYTPLVIVAKPLDTHLHLLLTIQRDKPHFSHLLSKLFIHDHYLNKPGIRTLKKIMPKLHEQHCFIDNIMLFLVEKDKIEDKEKHRLDALSNGMLFDLAVHLISILQEITPIGLEWYYEGRGPYRRIDRKIHVEACTTARYAGSVLGESTAIFDGRLAETFGILELRVEETISFNDIPNPRPRFIRVLIVAGKGVPVELGIMRDLKSVYLQFEEGGEVKLDLDTSRFNGVDSSILQNAGYYDMDLTQRGINLPLSQSAKSRFKFPGGDNPFQCYTPAFESIRILSEALLKAPKDPHGHKNKPCRDLLNELLTLNNMSSRFSNWDLPSNFRNLLIDSPPAKTVA